jgi:hypothetical protein
MVVQLEVALRVVLVVVAQVLLVHVNLLVLV